MKRVAFIILRILLVAVAAHGQIFIEGSLAHDREVEPGQSYSGTIEVGNAGTEEQAVRVYQTDYLFNAQGETFYGEAGSLPRSNGLWISVFPSRFTVPAKGSVAVTYRIEVPVDPNLRGTYWSMLMVEGIPPDSLEANADEEPPEPSIGIRQLLRYGIQIVTDIGSTGSTDLKIMDARLVREDEAVLLLLDVINSGERLIIPQVSAEAFNSDAEKAAVVAATTKRIYPGTSVRYRLDLSSLDSGQYQLLLIMDAGGENVFGASYSIQL